MTNAEATTDEEPHVGWQPRVIRGGKDEPPSGSNWLKALKVGTLFVAAKSNDSIGHLYEILRKDEKFCLLQVNQPDGSAQDIYVHYQRFSVQFSAHEVIGFNPPIEGERT